jgi:hypothetical protein
LISLEGKIALVTGGSRGIGAACACLCILAEGDRVHAGMTFAAAVCGMFVRQEVLKKRFNPMIGFMAAAFTTGLIAATGSIVFSAQPVVSSTITINGNADLRPCFLEVGVNREQAGILFHAREQAVTPCPKFDPALNQATERANMIGQTDRGRTDQSVGSELQGQVAVGCFVHEFNALPTLCLDRARDHARRLMRGEGREMEGQAGWLGGLPVSIKDLTDVAGVRTTYGSPLFRDHVPQASHPVVRRIEARGGIVVAKSNTPEFGAGGSTFNEVFGRTRNPWNTSLTCGGSTGGGAVSVATGEVWLAQGTDHAGSLRRPGTYCSVVGLRPSPGRVTRGTVNNLFATLSVQGPMARNIADLALFLDTMAGWCPLDPMTYDAPAMSYSQAVAQATPHPPQRAAPRRQRAG